MNHESGCSGPAGFLAGQRWFVVLRWRVETTFVRLAATSARRGPSLRTRGLVATVLIILAAGCASSPPSETTTAVATSPADEPTTTRQQQTAPPVTPSPDNEAPTNEAPTNEPPVTPRPTTASPLSSVEPQAVRTGAGALVDQDLALLHGLRVGLIVHRASVVDGQTLAVRVDDHPLVELRALFAPEHGLYGEADAGASVTDIIDPSTGSPVYSLYGSQQAPTPASLADIDVLVYDLQDVGVRFYTYTSTLGLAMQAAAAADVAFMVLDRPNPVGGDQAQGATLAPGFESFIGMYNVPSAYGLTAGELATLIQREGLLAGVTDLELTVVPVQNWSRTMRWVDTGLAWIPPSPNLPTADSALVYPGTVLFEATTISEGRGTDEPFTLIGATWIDADALAADLTNRALPGVSFEPASFAPRPIPGAATAPRFAGQELFGVRILVDDPATIAGVEVGLSILDAVLRQAESAGVDPATVIDRPDVFDRLAGSSHVRSDLVAGVRVDEIVASFAADHAAFAELSAGARLYE